MKFQNLNNRTVTVYFNSNKLTSNMYWSNDDIKSGLLKISNNQYHLYETILNLNSVELISVDPYKFQDNQVDRIIEFSKIGVEVK